MKPQADKVDNDPKKTIIRGPESAPISNPPAVPTIVGGGGSLADHVKAFHKAATFEGSPNAK